MKFFTYDNVNYTVSLDNGSILCIKEFAALLDPTRNKSKTDKTGKKVEKAIKEFKYIFLFFDWSSPYFEYRESDRHSEAFKDSELTQEEFDDPIFREACRKYDEMQNSSLDIRLLRAAMNAVEKQINYLEEVDLGERDINGKPIFKSKDLIAEIKGCKDLISGLRELEKQVKKGESTEVKLRGNAQGGLFDY